jgi:hypothetical protein
VCPTARNSWRRFPDPARSNRVDAEKRYETPASIVDTATRPTVWLSKPFRIDGAVRCAAQAIRPGPNRLNGTRAHFPTPAYQAQTGAPVIAQVAASGATFHSVPLRSIFAGPAGAWAQLPEPNSHSSLPNSRHHTSSTTTELPKTSSSLLTTKLRKRRMIVCLSYRGS